MTTPGGVPLGLELPASSVESEAPSTAEPSPASSTTETAASSLSCDSVADAAMDRFADGDNAAFDVLYRAIATRLHSYAARITGHNQCQTEDLVQHTFEMLCRARGRFVKGSRVMPWAICILRNRHRDMQKRPKVEEFFPEGLDDASPDADAPDPAECTERKQLDELLRQELSSLPSSQREVCSLLYYSGLTQAEVSETLDLSLPAVKSLVQRAKHTLRSIFADPSKGSHR